jgi:hypothetical protein
LVYFSWRIPQPVVVRDIVKEFLGVQCASEEQSKISVCSLYNVGYQIDSFHPGENILVRQTILGRLFQPDSFLENTCHP